VTESSTLRSDPPRLQRSLKLWHLVVYGIIIVQPTAPMGIYGVVSNIAHGHVATTVLIAMLAMLLTAISYGRMARVYPRAGSAFTYVSEEIDPRAGYLVGWAMLMDYLLNPVICIIWCSQAARNIVPGIPYPCLGRRLCAPLHLAEYPRHPDLRPAERHPFAADGPRRHPLPRPGRSLHRQRAPPLDLRPFASVL